MAKIGKLCLICILIIQSMMDTLLQIATASLNPDTDFGHVFEMTGRCAFAICTKGEFEIKFFNERYIVREHCMFACMPFVRIEVLSVAAPSEVVFGYIRIEDVPAMISRWVDTSNLSAIQNHPMVEITPSQLDCLMASIREYRSEYDESRQDSAEAICRRIQHDIVDFQCRLIVAKVLKIYFANIRMTAHGYTHRDFVYQRFMLALYGNFREHRDVSFYAMRSGVSLKYFSTIVRQLSGTSPSEWIETVVVDEAKSMLNDSRRSIKDIAAALNFPDAPTFTKYFLRVTGITPKAYRKSVL